MFQPAARSREPGPAYRNLGRAAAALGFLLVALAVAYTYGGHTGDQWLLLAATAVGGYLALNLGANDAPNNIGALVGSGALGLGAALVLAAAGELAGAFLAGDPVNLRLRADLFHADVFGSGRQLARVLLSGLAAAGLWLHWSTLRRIPISATHSVVGGLLGAGLFSSGWDAVQWHQIRNIATVWLAAPVIAASLAALLLHLIERELVDRPNAIGAARTQAPLLIAVLSLLLANYFFLELAPEAWLACDSLLPGSLAVAVTAFLIAQPLIHRVTQTVTNNRKGVNELFNAPLILAAGFFAFAHGANDVANVVAPLTALANIASQGLTPRQIDIPPWTLAIGGAGIAVGLLAYGGRIAQTVGHELTEIDKLRAFCVTFSSAVVVVSASHFGFPVSTTHILVGSIIGVGLLREFSKLNERETLGKIRKCHAGLDQAILDRFLQRFHSATLPRKREMLEELFRTRGRVTLTERERTRIRNLYHHHLVRRSLLHRIVLLWALTLPATALLGALLYGLLPWL